MRSFQAAMACTKEGVGLAIHPQSGHSSLHSSGFSTGVPPQTHGSTRVAMPHMRDHSFLAALSAVSLSDSPSPHSATRSIRGAKPSRGQPFSQVGGLS